MTFSFAEPYWLILLLLIPLIAWLKGKRGKQAAFLYSSVGLVRGMAGLTRSRSGAILNQMRWFCLACLVLALARPRIGEGESSISTSGIDIVVALDLSTSMAAEDPTPKGGWIRRLTVAKNVLAELIESRPYDRISLVAFAAEAYTASPLSMDHEFLLTNLDRLELNTIADGTAIGSAIGTGVNRLRDIEADSRILILMTDGQNNSGQIPPLTAAEAAEAMGVKIYTIGVGTTERARILQKDIFGRENYVYTDVNIDEKTLKEIAKKTNGKYYRADNAEALREIYRQIDELEKTEVEIKKFQRYDEIFAWAAVPGLFLLILELVLGNTVWRKLP